MIVEKIEGDFITRYSDDESKMIHKIGTNEFYKSAVDLVSSTYEYEEVDNPDYVSE